MRGQYTHYASEDDAKTELCERIRRAGYDVHHDGNLIVFRLNERDTARILFRVNSEFFEWGECPVAWRVHDRHLDQVQQASLELYIRRGAAGSAGSHVETYDELWCGFPEEEEKDNYKLRDTSRLERLLDVLRDFKASYWYREDTYVFLHGMGFGSFPVALDARLQDLGGKRFKHYWTKYACNYLFDQGAHHPFVLTIPVETSLRPNLMFTDKYDDPVHLEFTTPRQLEEFARASRLTAELFNTILRAVQDVREHDIFPSPLPLDAPSPSVVNVA